MNSVEWETDDYISKNKSKNYGEAMVVRSVNKSKNNDDKAKPNFIDEENLYGYFDSKPLTYQRRNQSYTNLQSKIFKIKFRCIKFCFWEFYYSIKEREAWKTVSKNKIDQTIVNEENINFRC